MFVRLHPEPYRTAASVSPEPEPRKPPTGSVSFKVVVLVTCTALLGILTANHLAALNGPAYWRWEWRLIPASRIYPATVLAVVPFFLAQLLQEKTRCSNWFGLSLVGLSALALELIAV